MNLLREFVRRQLLLLNEARLMKDFGVINQDVYRVVELFDSSSDERGMFVTVDTRLDTSNISKLLDGPPLRVKKDPENLKKEKEEAEKHNASKDWTSKKYVSDWIRYLNVDSDSSFVVDHVERTLDLDLTLFQDHKNRRRNPNNDKKSHTIPHTNVAYNNVNRFKKILKSIMKYDERVKLDYSIVGNITYEGLTISDILKKQEGADILKTHGTFVMYHGTSEKRAKEVRTKGLRPGNTPFEYIDLVKNYSEFNVYLTPSISIAENYATRAAIDDRSKAVVLKVVVRDFTKLIPDEDSLSWIITMNPNGEEERIHFKHMTWRSWPNAKHIMASFMTKLARGINTSSTIAYKGSIPARDISTYSTYKPETMRKDPSDREYHDAMEKTKASIKYGDKPVKKSRSKA